jgi:ATP-dependent exoDNAse (exonuclease V) alpha subunit
MDNASLQDVARGKIVWIDEAGFLSTRQMRWAVDFAVRNDCRLILSGDTRQHHAVERGDAMRLLEQTGAIAHAALTHLSLLAGSATRETAPGLHRGQKVCPTRALF